MFSPNRTLGGSVAGGLVALAFSFCLLLPSALGQATATLDNATTSVPGDAGDPVAIVAIQPVDDAINRISEAMRWAGVAQYSGTFSLFAGHYSSGFDREMPIGVAVTLNEYNAPEPMVMLPVTDSEAFFGAISAFGEPDDLGDGMYAMSVAGNTFYARQVEGWLFVSTTEESLDETPANPETLLGGMTEEYVLGVKLLPNNIPADFRDMLFAQLQAGYERAMAEQQQNAGLSSAEMDATRLAGDQSIEQIKELIQETESIVFGWNVDSQNKEVHLDLVTTFLPGSDLASQVVNQAEATSRLADFATEAPITFRATTLVSKAESQQVEALVGQLDQQINTSSEPEEVKQALRQLSNVLATTLAAGKVDFAGRMTLDGDAPCLSLVLAVENGTDVAEAVQQIHASYASKPGMPTMQFNVGQEGGVGLHTGQVSLAEANDQIRKVFGDSLELAIGTSADTVYVTAGKLAMDQLKSNIRVASELKEAEVQPGHAEFQMEPVVDFAKSIAGEQEDLEKMAVAMQKYPGENSVEIDIAVTENGIRYRTTLPRGVLNAMGASATQANQGF